MSKLIILRGNSGSGKSSAAKALQRKFGRNTMVLSQDIVRREMLWVKESEGNSALPLLIELLKYGAAHCPVVILEGILNTETHMPLFEAAIAEFGDQIYAYYYDLPFEETLRRHETKQNRFDFGEEHMRKWWKEKDFIDIIPETVLTKDISLEDAVNQIYSGITG